MQLRLALATSLLLVVEGVTAQDGGGQNQNPLAIYPPCAQNCIMGAFTNTTFCPNPLNQTCTCENAGFNEFISGCVLQSCSIREALTTHNISSSSCGHPVHDRSETMMRETIAMMTTTIVVVGTRIVFKLFAKGQNMWWDDYAIAFLLFFGGIPSMSITIAVLAPSGLGRDIWAIPFENIDRIFRFAFISGVLYLPQVAALKLTFLFFYLRIFPSRRTRQLIWGTIVFTCLFGLVYLFVGIFQCWPIEYWWVWDGSPGGKCMSKDGVQWSSAIISIVLDVWMMAIPLWNVRKLKLHWKKKIGVTAMFLVGAFVTIVCCIRLAYLHDITKSMNPTQVLFDIIRWSTIEGFTSSVCACMPALRQMLVRVFPKTLGSGTNNSASSAYIHYNKGDSALRSAPEFCLPHRVVELDPAEVNDANPPQVCELRTTSYTNTRPPVISRICQEAREVALRHGGEWGVAVKGLKGSDADSEEDEEEEPFYSYYASDLYWDPNKPDRAIELLHHLRVRMPAPAVSISADLVLPFRRNWVDGKTWDHKDTEAIEVLSHGDEYMIVLDMVVVHVRLDVATSSGLFGVGGDERIKLVDPEDWANMNKYRTLWRLHGSDQDAEAARFFDSMAPEIMAPDTFELSTRVAKWREDLVKVWIWHRWKSERLQDHEGLLEANRVWLGEDRWGDTPEQNGPPTLSSPRRRPWEIDIEVREPNDDNPWVQATKQKMPSFTRGSCFGCAGESVTAPKTSVRGCGGGLRGLREGEGEGAQGEGLVVALGHPPGYQAGRLEPLVRKN
ncbi:hypothetical protein MFIFM68171_03685 [Madurella fahalii]|uniref:CFEM domain-containing protein n=1 Tax=Madurella fahalii TaxID=1157608 RepID=A0ABQ0G6U4_9PEZI